MPTVDEFLARSRSKLVDTSMRSRLLNYRPGARGAAVDVVREHPVALWKLLVADERTLGFRAAPDGATPADAEAEAATPKEAKEPPGSTPEPDAFAAGIAPPSTSAHGDATLETALGAELLSLKLRRLADTARLTLEEQGVDTLFLALGFLRFRDTGDASIERRAPLLLVPAQLVREGPDRWKVKRREDDPLVNPALVEWLKMPERGGALELPPLPDPIEGFDPLAWFEAVQRLVSQRPGSRVTADCTLGIFSFQKFVMHEDLKRHGAVLARHDVVGRLAARSGSGDVGGGLPDDVAALVIDRELPAERWPHVVDADSTQIRALAAVERGHHLVIEGPPGTGKSQTITNLIAGALAAGKTVLFVAEKRAALEVVFDRIRKAGLGSSCFELHSAKANKGAVVRELRRTLDETLSPAPADAGDVARLAGVRAELTAYVDAVHRPVAPLDRSVYSVVGRLAALGASSGSRAAVAADGVDGATFREALETLTRLAAAAAVVGDPAAHPWRDLGRETLDLAAEEAIRDAASDLVRRLPDLEARVRDAAGFGVPADVSLAGASALHAVADLLEASPGVAAAVLLDPASPAAAARLAARGKALRDLEAKVDAALVSRAVPPALDAAAAAVERSPGVFRVLSPAWWSARSALRRATKPAAWTGARAAAERVRDAQEAAAERARLDADADGPRLFAARWRGADSDAGDLEATAAWIGRFAAEVAAGRLRPEAARSVERARPSAEPVRRLAVAAREADAVWAAALRAGAWPAAYLADRPLPEWTERVRAIAAAPAAWREWGAFASLLARAKAGVAGPVVLERDAPDWKTLATTFEHRFLERWMSAREESTPALRAFLGSSHEAKIEEFRRLDRETMEHHRRAIAAGLRTRVQDRLRDPALADDLKFLRGQLARERGHRPVRELLQRACGAVRAIKPCFLMSPMTVAQNLDPERHRFDLVVFDEASQVTPEDALGAVGRGAQVIVVGDSKQLPPTNFFAVQSGQMQAAEDDGTYDDQDSILELAQASGFARARLRWHYRSRHESLIAYSNRNFYESSLLTFPSAELDRTVRGLQMEFVEDGVYEGKGVNRVEAARVVERVLRHVRESPTKSLCVGTFSLPQQLAVQDEVERVRRLEPDLDAFLSLDRPEPFFVKNLESIQGDERDVVILSIGYGPGADGRVLLNFGPINGVNGRRRLNVLTTRARERMLVVTSMRADDIDAGRVETQGATLLQAFLRFAETGDLGPAAAAGDAPAAESPLEAEVGAALARAGLRVQRRVGLSGYRIDLGVVDPDVPGRFVCGIECDGAAYRSAEDARDRDRLRDSVLRGLGWRLHRLWCLDWWHDAAGQTRRLVDLAARSKAEALAPPQAAPATVAQASPAAAPAGDAPARAQAPAPFAKYRRASPRVSGGGILEATWPAIQKALDTVIEVEGPIHQDDLRARVLAAYGHVRSGARIDERMDESFRALGLRPGFVREGPFWRTADAPAAPRSREGTGIPAERISEAEYDAAVVRVLEPGPLPEEEIASAVRDGFGFGVASPALKDAVHGAIQRLSKAGRVGIGGKGLALRASG